VQREDDRDRAIDRALRQSIPSDRSESRDSARAESKGLAPSERSVSRGHVDGETLAAWAEGQLRAEATARIEQHLSDCAQCQQMLATFARTAPTPTVVAPLWRRWHLQWLVPIATAATVAAIWVAIPRDEQKRATSSAVDRVAEAPPASAPAESPAPQQSQNAVAAPQPSPPPPAQEFKQSLRARVAQSAPSAAKREELERRDAQERVAEPPAPEPAQPQGATLTARADTQEKDADKLQKAQESAARAAPAAPAAAPASTAEAAVPRGGLRGAAADTRALAGGFTAPAEIRAPNSANRWRIVDGGRRVERSINSGTQWETASLSAPGVLTTGMSPAPSISWIVGRAGAVYVTTDGLRFVRVMFPESIDLVSVTATDARHATVMAADGRSFRTEDGGMTWSRP